MSTVNINGNWRFFSKIDHSRGGLREVIAIDKTKIAFVVAGDGDETTRIQFDTASYVWVDGSFTEICEALDMYDKD